MSKLAISISGFTLYVLRLEPVLSLSKGGHDEREGRGAVIPAKAGIQYLIDALAICSRPTLPTGL
jgi:hypothetical protein